MNEQNGPTSGDQGPTDSRPDTGQSQPNSDSIEAAMPPPSGQPTDRAVSPDGSSPFATTVFPPTNADADADPAAGQTQVWRDQYESERKKARLFMVTTAVAVALLAASLFYAVATTSSSPVAAPLTGEGPGLSGNDNGGQVFRPPGGPDGSGSRGGLIERFFNSDGSVSEEAIAQFQERAAQFGGSSGFGDRLAGSIEAAVANGDITSEQANELLAALGLSSASSGA